MPDRKIHNLICKLAGIPEEKANYLNHMMDLPSQILGSYHRTLFHGQHTTRYGNVRITRFNIEPKDILELYALTKGDTQMIEAWILHILADKANKTKIHIYKRK